MKPVVKALWIIVLKGSNDILYTNAVVADTAHEAISMAQAYVSNTVCAYTELESCRKEGVALLED